MNTLNIDITPQSPLWDEGVKKSLLKAVEAALHRALPSLKNADVSLVLADDAFIQTLNKTYRCKDAPTNVLSFPQHESIEAIVAEPFSSLGDIILAYETIAREAAAQNKSFTDHAVHMSVHGTLHLIGYDHVHEFNAEEMEGLEIAILKDLGIKNPYESIGFMA